MISELKIRYDTDAEEICVEVEGNAGDLVFVIGESMKQSKIVRMIIQASDTYYNIAAELEGNKNNALNLDNTI